jgi:hypothetical protein
MMRKLAKKGYRVMPSYLDAPAGTIEHVDKHKVYAMVRWDGVEQLSQEPIKFLRKATQSDAKGEAK